MTGLAKRWVNDKGAVYAVVEDDEEVDPMITVIVLEPIGVPHANLHRIAVSRERLEDRQGWMPMPTIDYDTLTEEEARGGTFSNLLDPPSDTGYLDAFRCFGRAIRESLDRELLAVLKQAGMKPDPLATMEKSMGISPKQYSFTSVDVSVDVGDGVPRKLRGFESIDYDWKVRLDAQARAHATDPVFRVPAEFRYGSVPPRPFIVLPEMVSRVAEATKQPYVAPSLTPMPVRREVFGGGQWLDYALLADPDPFDRYELRRITLPGGYVQTWAQPAPREELCSWKNHAQADRMIAAKMLARDMSDRDDRPNIHGNVVPTFGIDPSCRPTLAGGIISLRRG